MTTSSTGSNPDSPIALDPTGLDAVQVRRRVTDTGRTFGTNSVTFEWNLIF